MTTHRRLRLALALPLAFASGLAWLWPAPALAQEAAPRPAAAPAGDDDPVLRLEGGGPLGPISAVAFSRDGATLYEAGWDKVVRIWRHDAETGRFALDSPATLRVPIGPGDAGVLNALALSPDGAWLATGGNAVLPEGAGFRQLGLIVPREGVADPLAQGVIYVFDLRTNPPACRQLRGHRGPIQSLAFADTPEGGRPRLLSAGSEPDLQGRPDRRTLVLRLWDVEAARELDRAPAGDYQKFRPWLAAWTLPPDHARVRAAAAWTEATSLVWDVGVAPPRPVADPFRGRSLVLAHRPGSTTEALLTGHFGEPPPGSGRWPEGYVAAWDEAAPASPARRAVVSWGAGGPADAKAMPVAQALVASRPGGPRDLLAVVLQQWTPPDRPQPAAGLEYRLQLLDLAPNAFGKVRGQVPLWTGPKVQPYVASAAGGTWLAVVGDPQNEILVHAVADLLRGRSEPQRLRGAGLPIGAATFARNGAAWGLRIRREVSDRPPPAAIAPDDLVFDFTNRGFAPSTAGWQPSAPAPGAWQSSLVAPRRDVPGQPLRPWHLWVYEDRKPVGGIALRPEGPSSTPDELRVTAHALLPPGAPGRVPVAAVALLEPGVGPSLWLFNGRTGERVRRLSGHSGTIRSLAFSADGRLLVSTADDRTACVWSLTDLDRVLGARGALPGLVVARRDGRYVVADVGRDSPYLGKVDLREGDVVEGLVEGGRVVAPTSANDLHFAAAARRPGQSIRLRLARPRQAPRDVDLTLGQAVDERKPLLTLFATDGGPGRSPEWLAWNPFGPYDASGPDIEPLFGWHFNADGRSEQPARFALAAQYPKFRREGLLREVIEAGKLPPPPGPAPLPRPEMELFLDPSGLRDGRERLLLQQPPTTLGLAIDGRVPADRVAAVEWRLDDGAPRPMTDNEQQFWSADLTGVTWDRRPHKLTVVLKTREPAQQFVQTQLVRYVPKAPRLIPRLPQGLAPAQATGLEVNDRRFRLAADVETAPGEKARVRLVCRHEGGEVREEYGPDFAARPLDKTLELKPGANTIELEAVNVGAGDDELRSYETERFGPLTVHYRPKPVDPPRIDLESLVLLPDGPGASAATRRVTVQGTNLGVVEARRVRLEGTIGARAGLVAAEIQADGKTWRPLRGFAANRQERFAFAEELALVPDGPEIRLRARDDHDVVADATYKLEYRPTVPAVDRLAAEPGGTIVDYGAAGEPRRVRLAGRLVGLGDLHPLDRVEVLVDDEALPDPAAVDRKAGTVSALVPLHVGVNRIRVQLRNRWSSATTPPVVVEYRRPPRVEGMRATLLDGRPFASVSARVSSPVAPSRAEVEVVSRASTPETPRAYPARVEPADGGWTLAAEVPVEQGENRVVARAWNDDGPSRDAVAPEPLVYVKPVEPKPVVVVETAEKSTARRPLSTVRFRVRSASPLATVELVRERSSASPEVVRRFATDRLERRPDGAYELAESADVELEPGDNAFKVVAVNAGGNAAPGEVVVSYVAPPVRLAIDGVESRLAKGTLAVPKAQADGPPRLLEPLADGRVALRGRVIWADDDAQRVQESPRVQVWVNGFPQVAADLSAVEGRPLEREFRAEVLLSYPHNQVDVRLNHAPLDLHGDLKFLVDCRKPERNARLHLWVVGVGDVDERGLRDRAVGAFQGRDFDEATGAFKTPAFPTAWVYGPDCKELSRFKIYGRLMEIRRRIPLSSRPSNDVVMIYYQGSEAVSGDQTYIRLRPGRAMGKDDVFPLSTIRERLDETRGAKVFLFDVTNAPDQGDSSLARSARWIRDDLPFGLLRLAWRADPDRAPDPSRSEVHLAERIHDALQQNAVTTLKDASEEVGKLSLALKSQFPAEYSPALNRWLNQLTVRVPEK